MKIRNLFVATVCLAVIGFVSEQSMAQGPNNLFSQYYTHAGASQVNASMYPAPHPVPHHVGGSYYTYQPLMPHEHMYGHRRDYYNYYATPQSFYANQCGGATYRGGYGVTKTSVRWQAGCTHIAPLPGITVPFQRASNLWNKRYTIPRGPINRIGTNFLGGAGADTRGCSRCGGAGCSECAGSYDSYDSGYNDYGHEGGYEESCSSCGDYAANSQAWQNARQQAAERTANTMQNRTNR